MCQKCGCNTCETDSTALMLNESKAPKTILSEGLKHHIDNNKPLTEHLYRAGSSAYFNLMAEARSLYSRGILEFTNEDDLGLLNETDLGHFGMFEGKKVPLDFPIELNEQMDIYDDVANMEFGMDYDQLGSNEKEWVRDEIDNMEMREAYSGFIRNPEDPDSEKFEPTGAVAEFREEIRALFGKFKGDLKNPEFIKGVAQVMVSWKSLLRSQLEEYNTGIYYKDEKTQDKAKEAGRSAADKVKDFIKKIVKEEEITVDDATEFKINLKHLLDKHEVKEEEGYSKFLKTDDNPEGKTKGLDTKTMNKILMNVIKDLDELKQLGEGVIEEELCAKGKAYRKKRMAAGEKSSAYLSGRAVKVCKGQMKG